MTASPAVEPFTTYQKKLLVFLSVATFFEGYDFIALSQILPNLRRDFDLPLETSGYLVAFINAGTVLAYFLVRLADRWGRRRVLTITIAGYTVLTFLTGLAPDVYSFAVLQMLARIFLLAEWAISMVVAAEEFPASRRGLVIGVVQGASGLGSVACAVLVPHLLATPFAWRTVYLVGILPLALLAYFRRELRETHRFTTQAPVGGASRSLFAIWASPYRGRLLKLGAIWLVSYIAAQNAVVFWKEHAVTGLGFTDQQVGFAVALAAGVSMPLVFLVGKLIDTVGRKPGAALVYTAGAIGTFLCFTLEGFWPVTVALMFGIFGAQAYLPVLNAYTAELFPTELRGDAFAWANNLIGRVAYVGAPAAVGAIVGATGVGYGPVVAATAVFPLLAIVMVYALLPETKDRELEDTAAF